MRAPTPLTSHDPRSAGCFRLLGRLASGGMGEVYLGRQDDRPDSLVVVKLLRADLALDPLFRERFAAEVAASRQLARMTGTTLARAVDADAGAERPWLATEYVPGPSLADAARHAGRPVREVVGIATAIAEALASMHAIGLVHGDVTPSNVVLGPDGVRLIDLGLVRTVDEPVPPGVRLGSPGWCAPEVAAGAPPEPTSDIHGWGCTVAFAASGTSPFGPGTAEDRQRRMLSADHTLDALPAALRALVAEALDPDPASRPDAATLVSWMRLEPWGGVPAGQHLPRPISAAAVQLLGPPTTRVTPPLTATQPVLEPTRVDLATSDRDDAEQRTRNDRRGLGAMAAVAALAAVLALAVVWGTGRSSQSEGPAAVARTTPASGVPRPSAPPSSAVPSATPSSVRTPARAVPSPPAAKKGHGKGKQHGNGGASRHD